jgi:hypothetical protein
VDTLQAVVDKDAAKFTGMMVKNLKEKTDTAVLNFLFGRNFPGNPKGTALDLEGSVDLELTFLVIRVSQRFIGEST